MLLLVLVSFHFPFSKNYTILKALIDYYFDLIRLLMNLVTITTDPTSFS